MSALISTEFPPALERIGTVGPSLWEQGRWSMTVDGLVGWSASFEHGLCVGLKVGDAPIDGRWLEQASLWLIASRGETDDALWLDAADALVFVRVHEVGCDAAALRTSLEQQVAIARWLGEHHAAAQGAALA